MPPSGYYYVWTSGNAKPGSARAASCPPTLGWASRRASSIRSLTPTPGMAVRYVMARLSPSSSSPTPPLCCNPMCSCYGDCNTKAAARGCSGMQAPSTATAMTIVATVATVTTTTKRRLLLCSHDDDDVLY